MSLYPYRVVDVFTQHRLEGNPLAVFPDAKDLDGTTMQKIAQELNLSETVFVLPPTSPEFAARLRIFTPSREMKFAGHPTVGASFVLLDEQIVAKGTEHFILKELVGPVPVRVDAGAHPLIWLTTPPIHDGPVFARSLCAETLGLHEGDLLDIPPQMLSAGNPTLFIALKNRDAVDRAAIEMAGMRKLASPEPVCIFVFAPTAEGASSRMFAPEHGIVEDPATGSSTGPLAAYMLRHGLTPGMRFVSEQGTKMGRRSYLHVHIRGEEIDIGGHVTPLVRATMEI